jgi:hypothetical protein
MYYVSVLDGPKHGLLAGPYDTHQKALDMVGPAKEIAQEVDPWAWFYAFGTCKMPEGYDKPGVLNHLLEEEK